MDDTEKIVFDFLSKQEPDEEILFEPNGYSTYPDFLMSGGIAVEATGLYQQFEYYSGKTEAIRELQEKFFGWIATNLPTISQATPTVSWFVNCKLRRAPAHNDARRAFREFRHDLRAKLQEFIASNSDAERKILVETSHYRVDILKASRPHESTFLLGSFVDFDEGGFVVSELIESIEIMLAQKAKKAASYFDKYAESWLVLVNYISLENHAGELLSGWRGINRNKPFDRLILLNPRNINNFVVLD